MSLNRYLEEARSDAFIVTDPLRELHERGPSSAESSYIASIGSGTQLCELVSEG